MDNRDKLLDLLFQLEEAAGALHYAETTKNEYIVEYVEKEVLVRRRNVLSFFDEVVFGENERMKEALHFLDVLSRAYLNDEGYEPDTPEWYKAIDVLEEVGLDLNDFVRSNRKHIFGNVAAYVKEGLGIDGN